MLLQTPVNLPTLLIAAVVAALFITVVARGIMKRKRGESGCGCGCSDCPNSRLCHSKESTGSKK